MADFLIPTLEATRSACRELLSRGEELNLNRHTGQFLGGEAFADRPMSAKQVAWVNRLRAKLDLPLFEGGDHA